MARVVAKVVAKVVAEVVALGVVVVLAPLKDPEPGVIKNVYPRPLKPRLGLLLGSAPTCGRPPWRRWACCSG